MVDLIRTVCDLGGWLDSNCDVTLVVGLVGTDEHILISWPDLNLRVK